MTWNILNNWKDSLSPVWTLIWILSCLESANYLSHSEQLYGLSPVWTFKCFFRTSFLRKDLMHQEQLKSCMLLGLGKFDWLAGLTLLEFTTADSLFLKKILFKNRHFDFDFHHSMHPKYLTACKGAPSVMIWISFLNWEPISPQKKKIEGNCTVPKKLAKFWVLGFLTVSV